MIVEREMRVDWRMRCREEVLVVVLGGVEQAPPLLARLVSVCICLLISILHFSPRNDISNH